MFFFKSKKQRSLERGIKRCGDWLTSQVAVKIFAEQHLREHRLALENDQGGITGFLRSPREQQESYIALIVEKMNAAEADGDECRFMCAGLFVMFLECYAHGFDRSAIKAIEVMERVQRVI